MQVTNLSPDGEVTVEWNPTETMRADADGNLEAELPIADDAEPGVYELTVTDEESGESNSVDYTVLSVDDPALTIDPETITLDEFIGDRKSTRLNSSHVAISYAVFCLKKKNKR